jgi:hypothetical protein
MSQLLRNNYLSFIDVNECTSNTHDCHVNATCSNVIGGYQCTCKSDYLGNGTSCRCEWPIQFHQNIKILFIIIRSQMLGLYVTSFHVTSFLPCDVITSMLVYLQPELITLLQRTISLKVFFFGLTTMSLSF